MVSWVFKNCSAAWGDETTIVGSWPSRNDMMGPYFLAKLWRARCGRLPSMWRLPMIGKEQGPGGSLGWFLWCFGRDRMRMNVQMDSRRKIANVNGDILGIELRKGMGLKRCVKLGDYNLWTSIKVGTRKWLMYVLLKINK